ncbi:MAG: DNA (cytosine-5-)-methyltransferase [bacterium]|nr:DNA (cytosine-5-)-methyltransferase [bacterium]
MKDSPRTYGVELVRGPFVSIPTHPDTVDSPADLVKFVSSREKQRPLAVDLFCGAGGLSVGLTDAGYDVVLGVDSDPVALETYAGLHPGLALCRDLGTPKAVDEVADLISELNVQVVAGGPPCQPFSKAGASKIRSLVQTGIRPEHDERRDLWEAFLEVVQRVQPPAVLFENVPDMAIAEDTTIVRRLVAELEADGYAVHTVLLHAYEHGVPQFRQRFFLVALAAGIGFSWPAPRPTQVTVGDAIRDLPPVEGGWRPPNGAVGFLPYEATPEANTFVRRARQGLRGANGSRIYDHITRPVRNDDRMIFESMNASTLYSEIDESLKRYRDDIFDDKYKRLSWDKPSRSITAHIARDGYWYIHPDQTRTLTVREAARLQTFPDHVRFAGPPTAAFRQIGNAVPPLLAERVAGRIRQALHDSEPNRPSTATLSRLIASWFDEKTNLAMPWLEAPTAWSALQGYLLLDRAQDDALGRAWPVIEKLDRPSLTIESTEELVGVAERIGRRKRVDRILEAANWYTQNPDTLTTYKGLRSAPNVGAVTAGMATLADITTGPPPVVVNRASLRVASRVFGLSLQQRRPGTDGRLAITRLLGGPSGTQSDDARTVMAGVLELAASLCGTEDPLCQRCPLATLCDTAIDSDVAIALG